jgi:hypothetical protein
MSDFDQRGIGICPEKVNNPSSTSCGRNAFARHGWINGNHEEVGANSPICLLARAVEKLRDHVGRVVSTVYRHYT